MVYTCKLQVLSVLFHVTIAVVPSQLSLSS